MSIDKKIDKYLVEAEGSVMRKIAMNLTEKIEDAIIDIISGEEEFDTDYEEDLTKDDVAKIIKTAISNIRVNMIIREHFRHY